MKDLKQKKTILKEDSLKKESLKQVKKSEENVKVANGSSRVLDFLINSSIVLTFFLCPIFFTGLTALGTGFEKMIIFYFLTLIGVVSWVTKGVVLGELKIKRTPLDLPIFIFLIVGSLSTFFSVSLKHSIIGPYGNHTKGFAAIVIFILFYYLVINNVNAKKIKTIFWSLLLSSFLVALYSVLQLFGVFLIPLETTHIKTFNPVGNLSNLTMFLATILPFFVVAVSQLKVVHPKMNNFLAMIAKLFLVAGLILIIGAMAILNGFTFWPVAICGVVIILMFFLSKIIIISNSNLLFPLVTFLALIVFLVLGSFNFVNLKLPTEVNLSRSISWDIAKNSLKENPFLGSGPATFYYDFGKFKGTEFNASPLWNVRFDSASGSLFEFLATFGILGTLAVVIITLIVISISFIALIKSKNGSLVSVVLASFSSFISVLILALLFSFSNSLIIFTILISIFAIASAIEIYPEKFRVLNLSFRASPKYALGLAALFLSVSAGVVILFTIGLKMYIADVYVKKAFQATEVSEKIEKISKAVRLFPYQDSYYVELSKDYMAMANEQARSGADQSIVGSSLKLSVDMGKASVVISPENAKNNETLALIYENTSFYTRGALESSEKLYEKVKQLEPHNPTPDLRLALIQMSKANNEEDEEEKKYYINEAIKKYNEAIEKKNDLTSAYYGKAIAYERLNDVDGAIDELKKAVSFGQDNIDYKFELGRMYFNRGISKGVLSQSASNDVIEDEIDTEEGLDDDDELSVETNISSGLIEKNEDLVQAEQFFLKVFQMNQRHANALYSLALIYQKTGERELAGQAVKRLMELITNEEQRKVLKEQFRGLY